MQITEDSFIFIELLVPDSCLVGEPVSTREVKLLCLGLDSGLRGSADVDPTMIGVEADKCVSFREGMILMAVLVTNKVFSDEVPTIVSEDPLVILPHWVTLL